MKLFTLVLGAMMLLTTGTAVAQSDSSSMLDRARSFFSQEEVELTSTPAVSVQAPAQVASAAKPQATSVQLPLSTQDMIVHYQNRLKQIDQMVELGKDFLDENPDMNGLVEQERKRIESLLNIELEHKKKFVSMVEAYRKQLEEEKPAELKEAIKQCEETSIANMIEKYLVKQALSPALQSKK